MAWFVLALGLLVVLGGLWWSRERPAAAADQWVATREGLVRFRGVHAVCVPWDAVTGVRRRGSGVELELALRDHRVFGRAGALAPSEHVGPESMGGACPERFAAMLEAVIAEPERVRDLPTFDHPDGPPEAVLADLTR